MEIVRDERPVQFHDSVIEVDPRPRSCLLLPAFKRCLPAPHAVSFNVTAQMGLALDHVGVASTGRSVYNGKMVNPHAAQEKATTIAPVLAGGPCPVLSVKVVCASFPMYWFNLGWVTIYVETSSLSVLARSAGLSQFPRTRKKLIFDHGDCVQYL